jgi:hypothetical protein
VHPPAVLAPASSSFFTPLRIILTIVVLHAAGVALVVTPLTDLVSDVVCAGDLQAAALLLSQQ